MITIIVCHIDFILSIEFTIPAFPKFNAYVKQIIPNTAMNLAKVHYKISCLVNEFDYISLINRGSKYKL